MKNLLIFIMLAFLNTLTSVSQVGIGTTNPATSSILELSSTNKALIVTRITNTSAITNPVNGMIVYDLSSNCMKFFANGAWTGCISTEPSTNGTGVISYYTCTTAYSGTLTAGTPASGVTYTITANVTRLGSYNISMTQNGVTLSGSGTFTGLGLQNIVLTATGTPLVAGYFYPTLNTNPNCVITQLVYPASIFLGNCASISAQTYRGLNGNRYSCNCTNTDYLFGGTIWGTNTYTDDSSIVRAAVHSGRIAPATAGTITFRIAPGLGSYTSSTQNGITSSGYGAWSGSFDFN